MVSLTKQISTMVEQLREPEQILVFEIIKRFLSDDIATDEDLKDISIARKEFSRGETINHNDIDWD